MATIITPLPRGAIGADTFDQLGTRVIFGPAVGDEAASARATAIQAANGAIVDDPTEESPHVELYLATGELTPAAAEQLAHDLIAASDLAREWELDAAIARHPAGRKRRQS
jgi:hypothetical protein